MPIGALAFAGIIVLPAGRRKTSAAAKLDWLGFGSLSIAIAALQVFLDRGEQLDWFSSVEILIEAVVCASALLHLPRPHLHREKFLRESAAVPRPQFLGRDAVHLHHRHHLSGVAGVDDALSADADGLSGGDGRTSSWARAASAPWLACSWSAA